MSAADSRKVTVSNLPPDMDDDTLLLILESSRYCPNGGAVREVVISSSGTSATVTFEQDQDAHRVIGTQINYNGAIMYLNGLQPAAPPSRKVQLNPFPSPGASPNLSTTYLMPTPQSAPVISCSGKEDRGTASGSNSFSADQRHRAERSESCSEYGNIHGPAAEAFEHQSSDGVYDDSFSGHYGNLGMPDFTAPHAPRSDQQGVYGNVGMPDFTAPPPPRSDPQGFYGNLGECAPPPPPLRQKSTVDNGNIRAPLLAPKMGSKLTGNYPGEVARGAGRRPLPLPEAAKACGISGQADSVYEHYTLDQEVHVDDQESAGDSSSGRIKDVGCTEDVGKPAPKTRPTTGLLSGIRKGLASVFGGGSKDSADNAGHAAHKADKQTTPSDDDAKAAVKLKNRESSTAADLTSKDILVRNVPDEKLRLLHKLVLAGETKYPCKVRVDFDSKLVTAIGNAKDVSASEKSVQQFFKSECRNLPVHVSSRNLSGLLLSDKGEKWLAEWTAKNKLTVQFYSDKDTLNVVAANSDTAERAKSRLEKDLSTTRVPLEDGHVEFIRSRAWSDFVRDKESESFVRITMEQNESVVVIEGSTVAVKSVADQVAAQLKSKTKISKKIALKAGVFRLLERFHKDHVQHIVRSAVQRGQNRGSVEVTFNDRKTCIELAGTAEDIKLAEDSVNKFIGSDIGYDRLAISEPGITLDDFKSGSEAHTTIVCLELDKKCAVEICTTKDNQSSTRQDLSAKRPDGTSQKTTTAGATIIVEKGNLPEFKKADVLVNLIPEVIPDLSKAGAVANGFLVAAGQKLQEELKTKWPIEFGRDVARTSAYGKVRAKKIYHAAVRRHRNNYSFKLMEDMILKCITMATQDGMSTIAFPTVGCGRLHYEPERVADTFQKVIQKLAPTLTVYIIAFDEDTRAVFHDYLSRQAHEPSMTSNSTDTRIEFHINTLNKSAIPDIKRTLHDKVSELATDTETIRSPVIGKLNSACEQEIKSLNAAGIAVEIDKTANAVKLRGNKKRLQQCKVTVNAVLDKQRMLNESPEYIKLSGSVEDYLSFLANEGAVRYPPYWTGKDPSRVDEVPYRTLDSKSDLYKEVENVIYSTWQPNKVGIGYDAPGLTHKKIEIQNIFVVENPALFQMYHAKRKIMCQKALARPYPATKGLQGEEEILSRSLVAGLKILPSTLVEEINEVFLLHGTKPVNVNAIMNDGLDERLGGDDLLFGKGSYFAETATKSDQYADLFYMDPQKKDVRTPPGTKLYMYMARVLLGNPFVCTMPQKFRRPPCDGAGCNKDNCDTHTTWHDSVIGTHCSTKARLQFREFIVYEKCASYLDFLIEYVRQ